MLGLSNSQLLITIGFIAAVTGPKDLQKFARLGGIFLGRASGYIQVARGHLNGVMQQAQMQEISKEIQDLRSKIDVISHGANFSLFPTPLTRRVETDSPESTPTTNENITSVKVEEKQKVADHWTKAQKFSGSSTSVNLHAQATAFSRLSKTVRGENLSLNSGQGLPPVLPVSAEMAKFLPQRKETARGSDIMLEAVLEAEVAHNAKDFFSQAGKETLSVKGEVSLDERDTDFDQYGIHIKGKFRESGQLQVLSSHHQSGGERSVSTILYLVSLQDLTNCPFRVVDEINQGMDPVNERKMFQQLVRAASQLNTPQCFLLTPKLLPELEYSEACSILNIMNGPWIEQPSKVWSFGDSWGNLIRSSQSGQCS